MLGWAGAHGPPPPRAPHSREPWGRGFPPLRPRVRSQAGSIPWMIGPVGTRAARTDFQGQVLGWAGPGAEEGPQPPGGSFIGTLGWGVPRAGLGARFTPVLRWRGGRAAWVCPPGPGCEQTLRPVSRFPFSKSFPPLIRQLLGGVGSSSPLRRGVWSVGARGVPIEEG